MKTAGMEGLFSKEQIEEHLGSHYLEQVKRLKEIEARICKAGTAFANSTYCDLRALKKALVYAENSIRLHECYFTSLGGAAPGPCSELLHGLGRDFGSEQEWEEQFVALGLCSRGWVVLGFDLRNGRLCNYLADDPAEGAWLVLPLLVLDVCEHAYCRDYFDRLAYIKAFIAHIDWNVVSRRYSAAREMYLCGKAFI
ncbi:MAG: Fe-Mn family superoxide dismutase [Firmicutes bacterium]|nr:Fe-Mn family superoxide dismutase [Bacillota bacterium]